MTQPHESATPPLTLNADEHPCPCVVTHVPTINRTQRHHIFPLGMGGPDTPENVTPVCPNTHDQTHLILEEFRRTGASRARRRDENRYAHSLAIKGWDAYKATVPVTGGLGPRFPGASRTDAGRET